MAGGEQLQTLQTCQSIEVAHDGDALPEPCILLTLEKFCNMAGGEQALQQLMPIQLDDTLVVDTEA
jgi:hypothetical protein